MADPEELLTSLRRALPRLLDEDFFFGDVDLYVRMLPGVEAWLEQNYRFYSAITRTISRSPQDQERGPTWLKIPLGSWQSNFPRRTPK